jgi:hypothetical protein
MLDVTKGNLDFENQLIKKTEGPKSLKFEVNL